MEHLVELLAEHPESATVLQVTQSLITLSDFEMIGHSTVQNAISALLSLSQGNDAGQVR